MVQIIDFFVSASCFLFEAAYQAFPITDFLMQHPLFLQQRFNLIILLCIVDDLLGLLFPLKVIDLLL